MPSKRITDNMIRSMGAYVKVCLILYMTVLITAMADVSLAEERTFNIQLTEKTISEGKTTDLKIFLPGDLTVSAPVIPEVDGLSFKYKGVSLEAAGPSGKGGLATIYTFRVSGDRSGVYEIGPISFKEQEDTYTSNNVFLDVSTAPGGPGGADPSGMPSSNTGEDIKKHIFLEIDVPVQNKYVGEKIQVSVRFFTDWLDIENLKISDAPGKDYISGDFSQGDTRIRQTGGVKYAVLTFSKWILMPRPGVYEFGPVRASFEITPRKDDLLNENESFFNNLLGRKQSFSQVTEKGPVDIEVLPFPDKDRPAGFRGAVGEFDMQVEVSPKEIERGGDLELRVRIHGPGNIDTVTPPDISVGEGVTVRDPRVIKKDDNEVVYGVAIKFGEQAVSSGITVSLSYFSPAAGKYVTVERGPFDIKVTGERMPPERSSADIPGKAGTAVPASAAVKTGKRAKDDPGSGVVHIKQSAGRFTRVVPGGSMTFVIILFYAAPAIILPVIYILRKRLILLSSDTPYARCYRSSRAVRKYLPKALKYRAMGRDTEFYTTVFRMMQVYLGLRLSIPPESLTEKTVEDILRDIFPGDTIISQIKGVFDDCYLAVYGGVRMDAADMESTFEKAEQVIARLDSEREI